MTRYDVRIPASEGVSLEGELVVPPEARGLVVFAHGSGSSRHSVRNRFVAESLNRRGFATLLFDLLTAEEDLDRGARFDIALLAQRLDAALRWAKQTPACAKLPLGLFGASTGAAAAILVAAVHPTEVRAVVSRGGRPDLAGPGMLDAIEARTLLIVGGADTQVLALNRAAQARMRGHAELAIVPHATHLFEERGALEAAAELAGDWFARWL